MKEGAGQPQWFSSPIRLSRHLVFHCSKDQTVLQDLRSGQQLPCGEEPLGFCDIGRLAYFSDRIVHFGGEEVWFRRFESGKIVSHSMGILIVQEDNGQLVVHSYREPRELFL